MKVTVKKLADLHPPKKNVRMHTDRQLKEFKRSIEQFGQIRPMIVDALKSLCPWACAE